MPWLVISWLTAKARLAAVTGSSAATPVALTPFIESNRPDTTTWLPPPVTTMAIGTLLVFVFPLRLPVTGPTPGTGAHGRRAPFAADTAASRLRLTPPTALRLPPRYTVASVAAIARTWLLTLGAKPGTTAPAGVRATIR